MGAPGAIGEPALCLVPVLPRAAASARDKIAVEEEHGVFGARSVRCPVCSEIHRLFSTAGSVSEVGVPWSLGRCGLKGLPIDRYWSTGWRLTFRFALRRVFVRVDCAMIFGLYSIPQSFICLDVNTWRAEITRVFQGERSTRTLNGVSPRPFVSMLV